MSEISIDNIICYKKSTIKKLRHEFSQLKDDIIENKDLYEDCLKRELNKNVKLKDLIKDISSNLSLFILDSENQLIYIEKLSKENKSLIDNNILLINENKILKNRENIFYLTIFIVFIFNYFMFIFIKYLN